VVIASSTRGFAIPQDATPPWSAGMPGSPKIRMEKAQWPRPARWPGARYDERIARCFEDW